MMRRRGFRLAFGGVAIAMAMLNAVPFVLTRHAPEVDGVRIAGFPFAFHRVGGDCAPQACGTFAFHAGYFVADAAIALGVAVALAALASRVAARHGR